MLEPLRLSQLTVALDARLIGEDAVFRRFLPTVAPSGPANCSLP